MERVFDRLGMCVNHGQFPDHRKIPEGEIPGIVDFRGTFYCACSVGLYLLPPRSDRWELVTSLPFTIGSGFSIVATGEGLVVFNSGQFWVFESGVWQPVIESVATRRRHAMCYVPPLRCVVLMGGETRRGDVLTDSWVLWIDKGEVTPFKPQKEVVRSRHSVTWVDGTRVCVFGGKECVGAAPTQPVFIDVVTGAVETLDIFAPFPPLMNSTGWMFDGRLYYTSPGDPNHSCWILDLQHEIWLTMALGQFHPSGTFILPIEGGFRVFNENLLQSVELFYASKETFIDELVQANINSKLYVYPKNAARKKAWDLLSEYEKVSNEMRLKLKNSDNMERVRRLNELTSFTTKVRRGLIALNSIRDAWEDEIKDRDQVASQPPAHIDESQLKGMLDEFYQLKTQNRNRGHKNEDRINEMRKGLIQYMKTEKLKVRTFQQRNADMLAQCQANAKKLNEQKELIASLEAMVNPVAYQVDPRALLIGAEQINSIDENIRAAEGKIRESQKRFADLRLEIAEKVLEIQRVSRDVSLSKKALMQEVTELTRQKERNEEQMKRFVEERLAALHDIVDKYTALLQVTQASATEGVQLADDAARSIENLLTLMNKYATANEVKGYFDFIRVTGGRHETVLTRPVMDVDDSITEMEQDDWLTSTLTALNSLFLKHKKQE